MFGYVRPLKDELKVREFDDFKACYCGLCHTLKTRYGAFASNFLSYDFVFLAMLLGGGKDPPGKECSRCTASPFVKKPFCAGSSVLDISAGCSVILTWWKLRDSVRDEHFFKSLRDRLLSVLLRGAYKKAARSYPEFAEEVRKDLELLGRLENSQVATLDACADKFARLTSSMAAFAAADASRFRPLEQLLYHTGRFIYIVDACDDLQDDLKEHRFNPVAKRFHMTAGTLTEEHRGILKSTLMHSCGLAGAAYALLPESFWSPVLSNIIYLGMPSVCARVLDGTWRNGKAAGNKGMDETL